MASGNRVERVAHRGAKREFPENTLPAFERAFQRGANAVELDVHATRDGIVVVHHDSALGAAAKELAGVPIVDLSWRELNGVHLDGARIPSLRQVLAATPSGVTVYVEVKGTDIEELVAADVLGSSTRSAVHSFDHAAVARFAEVAPEIPRGILFDRLDGIDVEKVMGRTGARDVWPDYRLVDTALVDQVHRAGGRVIAWTVNDRRAAERLAAIGVDGLCTDDVRILDGL